MAMHMNMATVNEMVNEHGYGHIHERAFEFLI